MINELMRVPLGIRIVFAGSEIMDRDIWQKLQTTSSPIIIYGTGNGADKVLDEMAKRGISPAGIMASDDFVRGQRFRGYTVKSLSDHLRVIDDPVIIIAFGTQRREVMDNILSLAGRYRVLCADVPVYGGDIFDRSYCDEHYDEIVRLRNILADEQSVRVLDGIIDFRLSGELPALTDIFSGKDEAFGEILRLGAHESYLDLGAYRGDTIAEFLNYSGGSYEHITALEPDIRTYKKLREYASGFPDTQLFNMGIWSNDCDLILSSSLGRGSSLAAGTDSASRSQSQSLAVTCIDTLYKRRVLTYLKMDVEGAEEQALLGGAGVIARDRPKLNIALYHRTGDFFRLPLLIHSIAPEYKLYLRQHPHIPDWDLNLYAV